MARGTYEERINYRSADLFYVGELKDNADYGSSLENFIVLVGYVGDYWSAEIDDYAGRRITPMNSQYGWSSIPPGHVRYYDISEHHCYYTDGRFYY